MDPSSEYNEPVRWSLERPDEFLKEWGDKGQTEPGITPKFAAYTTRYNKQYWVSVEGMDRHYQRADLDAVRSDDRKSYAITTHNISRPCGVDGSCEGNQNRCQDLKSHRAGDRRGEDRAQRGKSITASQ